MKQRARALDFHGLVEHRHEAEDRLRTPGQAVVVHRGVDRSLTMVCPDGCGEMLTINLDRRAGAAWKLYLEGRALSLFPSVWRTTGCRSHFIVWRSSIYWCDRGDELHSVDEALEERVASTLSAALQAFPAIAEGLGAVPWAVLSACRRLQRSGLADEGTAEQRGWFRRPPP